MPKIEYPKELLKQHPTFDPKRDRGLVFEGLAPDIQAILDNDSIPAGSCVETFANQLDTMEKIGCRVNDKFDMLRYQQSLKFADDNKATAGVELNPNSGTGSSSGA